MEEYCKGVLNGLGWTIIYQTGLWSYYLIVLA